MNNIFIQIICKSLFKVNSSEKYGKESVFANWRTVWCVRIFFLQKNKTTTNLCTFGVSLCSKTKSNSKINMTKIMTFIKYVGEVCTCLTTSLTLSIRFSQCDFLGRTEKVVARRQIWTVRNLFESFPTHFFFNWSLGNKAMWGEIDIEVWQ